VLKEVQMIFSNWDYKTRQLWGNQPVIAQHDLSSREIFSLDYLAALIDRYPHDMYSLVKMGAVGSDRKEWTEGKIKSMNGREVIDTIRKERLWINLRHTHKVDPRFQSLIDEIFEELHKRVPELPPTFKRICGILISNSAAQVYYHFDTTLQSLWQIHGSKLVYVYPPTEPFLKYGELTDVMLYHNETKISYESWYDEHAHVFDLQAGHMLNWPTNAPHRIVNTDFSVSFTLECFTRKVRLDNIHAAGDRLLPSAFSWLPWPAKAGLVYGASRTGLLDKERQRRNPISFWLGK
jgi:hypothetical protein